MTHPNITSVNQHQHHHKNNYKTTKYYKQSVYNTINHYQLYTSLLNLTHISVNHVLYSTHYINLVLFLHHYHYHLKLLKFNKFLNKYKK